VFVAWFTAGSPLHVLKYIVQLTFSTGFFGGNLGSVWISVVLVTAVGKSTCTTSYLFGKSQDVWLWVIDGKSLGTILLAKSIQGVGELIWVLGPNTSGCGGAHCGQTTQCQNGL